MKTNSKNNFKPNHEKQSKDKFIKINTILISYVVIFELLELIFHYKKINDFIFIHFIK